ncbi:MAG: TRAP transporter substrate-binding protein DctP [Deltaproteobacteria bacterium]|nr:TRAP transporter substrate-binding protein DctP [Deltaproteobacteria bacterium]
MRKTICLFAAVFLISFMLISPLHAKPIKLRSHNPVSPQSIFVKEMLVPWSKMIEERTAAIGKPVKISVFTGSAIIPFGQHYRAVLKGTVDMSSNIDSDLVGDAGGVADVMNLPFLFKTTKAAALTALDLYEKYPEFRSPFSKAKLMWFQPTGPSNVIFSKKAIKTAADLKGLKTFAPNETINNQVSSFGCIPVDIPFIEVYQALDRGLIDYIAKDWEAAMAFKFFEVTDYRTILPVGFQSGFLIASMNWDTWNGLPPDVQKVFEELNGRYMTEYTANKFDKIAGILSGVIGGIDKKRKAKYYTLPDSEFKKWKEMVIPVYEGWVKKMEKKGLPGKAVFEDAKRLGEKYSQ